MDDIQQLKKLAGIGQDGPLTNPNGGMSPLGSNISITAAEKRQYEREHKIQPGTDAWFKLWFSRPYLTGEKPY
jgi:hypothetical protein